LRLISAMFTNVLELNGRIDFPKDKIVVIYGANLQGKTNIINAIRYAFLRGIRRGRKEGYDEWALTTTEETAPAEGSGEIEIVFEHDGNEFSLHRIITRDKPDRPIITGLARGPAGKARPEDPELFLKETLKVNLLDIMFAPETAGGFRRLRGGEIEEALGEVFKEVIAARQLATQFCQRLERMKSGANAEMTNIRDRYARLLEDLRGLCEDVLVLQQFEHVRMYEPGKTYRKMSELEENIHNRIRSLEDVQTSSIIREAKGNAARFDDLRTLSHNAQEIKKKLTDEKEARSDLTRVTMLINGIQRARGPDEIAVGRLRLHDEESQVQVGRILERIENSKRSASEAKKDSRKLDVRPSDINSDVRKIESVISILKTKKKIVDEGRASLTKVGGKVYAVVPIRALLDDHDLSDVEPHPLPKGPEVMKMRHLQGLVDRRDGLLLVRRKLQNSQGVFNRIQGKDVEALSESRDRISRRARRLRADIDEWSSSIGSGLAAVLRRPQRKVTVMNTGDVDRLTKSTTSKAEKKRKQDLAETNRFLKPLGLILEEISQEEVDRVEAELRRQKTSVPGYTKAVALLGSEKEQWRTNDDLYMDYSTIPSLADEALVVMNAIIDNSIDEQQLRKAVSSRYNNIITRMKERRLIEAVARLSDGAMRAEVIYGGRVITHPAGAEKAFFSLAILTALGHYFGMPVLIDEVANNVDSKNLRAFFELAVDLKTEMGVQFLLSVKQTRDFDFDGWVRELADDMVIYEVVDKNIELKNLGR